MKIQIHIERLVLDGLPLEKRHGREVRAAVERELTRLLAANGLGREWRSGGAVPRLRADSIQLANDIQPNQIGQQIARSVYSEIGGKR
jgi:hypothetical protein